MEQDELLELLKARTTQRELQKERLRMEGMSPEKKVGNFLLGIGAGFSDALTKQAGSPEDVLGIYNRTENARLKALEKLESDSGVDDLLTLYKIQQSDKLARDLQTMRDEAAMRKEEKTERRFEKGLEASERRQDKSIGAQFSLLDKKLEADKKKSAISRIDAAQKAIKGLGYKEIDPEAAAKANQRAMDRIKEARQATKLRGPVGGQIGNVMRDLNIETPEFGSFNSLMKDAVSRLIKERSGTAASEPEMKRLEAVLPRITQKDATFDAVMKEVIKTADNLIEERRAQQRKVVEQEVISSIPDEEMRQKALDAISRGADPVMVLERTKELLRKQ